MGGGHSILPVCPCPEKDLSDIHMQHCHDLVISESNLKDIRIFCISIIISTKESFVFGMQ